MSKTTKCEFMRDEGDFELLEKGNPVPSKGSVLPPAATGGSALG